MWAVWHGNYVLLLNYLDLQNNSNIFQNASSKCDRQTPLQFLKVLICLNTFHPKYNYFINPARGSVQHLTQGQTHPPLTYLPIFFRTKMTFVFILVQTVQTVTKHVTKSVTKYFTKLVIKSVNLSNLFKKCKKTVQNSLNKIQKKVQK